MSYQLKEVFENFLKEETITRLSIYQIKTLPNVIIQFPSFSEQIYQRIEHNFSNQSKIQLAIKDSPLKFRLKRKLYNEFFKKMLNERKIEEFETYLNYENQIKSCEIVIHNTKISCPKPQFRLDHQTLDSVQYYFGNLNHSFKQLLHNKYMENNLEKISFEFPLKNDIFTFFFGSNKEGKYFTIFSKTESNLFFNSYSVHKLKSESYYCDSSSNDRTFYSNFETDFCFYECKIDYGIRNHKCLIQIGYTIDLNEHLKTRNYKFCDPDYEQNLNYYRDESLTYCVNKCRLFCGSIYYQFYGDFHETFNSTKLNLIPISSPHFRYMETLKTDINGLIYNLGGILGLWFGIYPVSFVYMITSIISFFRKMKQLLPKFINFLNSIIRKLVIKTKSFITILINILRICCIKTTVRLTHLFTSLSNYCYNSFDN